MLNGNFKSMRFSKYEIEVFHRICRKYKSRIEKKEKDAASVALKRATWIAIRNEYNNVPNVEKRSENQLVQLYRDLKKKATREREKMEIIRRDSEGNENNESSEPDLRPISMSSLELPFKTLSDIDNSEGLMIQNNTCSSSDNVSLNTVVKCEIDSDIDDNDLVAADFIDTVLDSAEPVTDTSSLKFKKSPALDFLNFEENYVRQKKNSTDESCSNTYIPSSNTQMVTCSRPSAPSEDRTMHRQVVTETYSRDSLDSAFCHYMHTMLTTIPECFEKERAKIQMTEILVKLKYPQG